MTSAPLLYALLLLMIVGWAGNYIAAKIALESLPAVLLYGFRISMAAALMVPVYLWNRRRHQSTWTLRDLPLMVGIGVFGVSLNQFLFVVGLSRTSVAHAAIFANLSPFLVLLLASASGPGEAHSTKTRGRGSGAGRGDSAARGGRPAGGSSHLRGRFSDVPGLAGLRDFHRAGQAHRQTPRQHRGQHAWLTWAERC